mmetsp:Transcript_541/g.364  ORF Transcript_541/g.364 Transcript_541/m.364 type:complete len:162 (-) Transcript_541:2409-2894(-)
MIKAVGIDPGLAATGIGIVKGTEFEVFSSSYGVINTSNNSHIAIRLNEIFSKLQAVLHEEKPDLIIIEDVFSFKEYPKSGILLGKVSGVILLAGCQAGIPVVEVAVREAKQILTGNGNASKIQLERSVRGLLRVPVPIKPNHASDALALALIGLFRYSDRL